jgi:PAS domain S-box-containing protein
VSTNLISRSGEVAYWGYAAVRSYLYPPMTFYMVGYISIGLVYCYKFYKMIPSTKEKTQAKLLIFAFLIPLIGGSLTQVVFPLIGLKVVPLSTTLTTITSGIIAFAMVRYGLMSITPGMAAENIIETMTDYVIVIKTDNTISLVNMSFLDALGYERNELKNKPVGSLLTRKGEFKTRVTDRLEKEGRVTNYETDLRTKKGKHISVSLNGSVIRNKFKKIIGFVLVMRDIREAKSMIRELTKNANELEKSKHELEIKVGELEKFSKLTVGKELKMINFKKKILELEEQLNRHGIEHMGEE